MRVVERIKAFFKRGKAPTKVEPKPAAEEKAPTKVEPKPAAEEKAPTKVELKPAAEEKATEASGEEGTKG